MNLLLVFPALALMSCSEDRHFHHTIIIQDTSSPDDCCCCCCCESEEETTETTDTGSTGTATEPVEEYGWVMAYEGPSLFAVSGCADNAASSDDEWGVGVGLCDQTTLGRIVFIPQDDPPTGTVWALSGFGDIPHNSNVAAGHTADLSTDGTYLIWYGGADCASEESVGVTADYYRCELLP